MNSPFEGGQGDVKGKRYTDFMKQKKDTEKAAEPANGFENITGA